MPFLIDTNVAARRMQPADPQFGIIVSALGKLYARGEMIYVTPKILVEFHSLATRPLAANGWGLTSGQALSEAGKIVSIFPMLHETPDIYHFWTGLVREHNIVGRQVFDARLVAVMMAHNVDRILTLNPKDFRRFPHITVVEPALV